MAKHLNVLALGILLLTSSAVEAKDTISIKLFSTQSPDSVSIFGPLSCDLDGRQIYLAPGRAILLRAQGSSVQLWQDKPAASLNPLGRGVRLSLRSQSGSIRLGPQAKTRRYAGKIQVRSQGSTLQIINEIEARQYIESVVGSESPPGFPLQALRAQSIISQTNFFAGPLRQPLPDSTEREAYLGLDYVRPEVAQAVASSWGKQLVYANRAAKIYYHSTCAGGTSSPILFGKEKSVLPYLQGVECMHCLNSPFFQELISRVPKARAASALKFGLPQEMELDSRQRPLKIVYSQGKSESGYELWLRIGQNLGFGKVPGMRFQVQVDGDDIVFKSKGAGHGIGMCQWGTCGLAKKGMKAEEILAYYFPGAFVVSRGIK